MYTRKQLEEGVVLCIDKPAGWTSFDVVAKVRALTGVRKVGHAGTLDPFATGLLLVATGRATKKIASLTGLVKEYEGVVEFGRETDTLDPTGKVVRTCPVPELSREALQEIANRFVGEIEQRVPAYSAVKVGGKRLYKLARKGKTVEAPVRRVTVEQFDVRSWRPPLAEIFVRCHAGTYVRALARDVGIAAGSCAYLRELRRVRIGPYKVEDAIPVERLADVLLARNFSESRE